MTDTVTTPPTTADQVEETVELEQLDVLIVGAGISGISAAWHLQERCPGKTYAILEARESLGGTWDLFRYPGVRSDSDMFTLGFRFRPWLDVKTLAAGPAIKQYLQDTTVEFGIDQHIRYRTRMLGADWSSSRRRWTVSARDEATGQVRRFETEFLFMCSGYYRYSEGYLPEFAGIEQFAGQVVHPQHWPEDLDYNGKNVVVIGSGATAITLVPAMTDQAELVTMLQRSPTYITSLPSEDPIASLLRKVFPPKLAYPINRWKNWLIQSFSYELSRRAPKLMRGVFRRLAITQLPKDYPVDVHFKPKYNPWDQRLCVVPDGDLFRVIRNGKAQVVTDEVETFTPTGIRLRSGQELAADVVVTATGLNLEIFGGATVSIDGKAFDAPNAMCYKGLMVSGVPNFAFTIGYTNASWTLKADLVSEYVCRLLNHMDAHGLQVVTPIRDSSVDERPFMDFTPGYVLRSLDHLPRQGAKRPWRLNMNYALDVLDIRRSKIADGALTFDVRTTAATAAKAAVQAG